MRQIYIVDDDKPVRSSLSMLLETAGFAVRVYEDGQDFLGKAAGLEAGCVLLDVRMPGMDGFGVMAAVVAQRDKLPIVIMTGDGDIAIAVQAMKAGAFDFIEKPFSKDVLLEILERAFAPLDDQEWDHGRRTAAALRIASLSKLELEVLHGLIDGCSNKVLAHDLGTSIRTVEMNRASIMERLGARSLADAVRAAFDGGAAPPTPR